MQSEKAFIEDLERDLYKLYRGAFLTFVIECYQSGLCNKTLSISKILDECGSLLNKTDCVYIGEAVIGILYWIKIHSTLFRKEGSSERDLLIGLCESFEDKDFEHQYWLHPILDRIRQRLSVLDAEEANQTKH